MNTKEYINENYKLVKSLKRDGTVMIAKCVIDDGLYVVKNKKAYDSDIYKRLKEEDISGVPKIYEVLESEEGLWIIEEFIQGRTLEEFFGEEEYMEPADGQDDQNLIEVDVSTDGIDPNEVIGSNAAEWMLTNVIESVAKTLQKLHSMTPPVIHRDVKPNNILITDQAEIKLLDFNISRGYTGKSEKDTVAMGTKGFAPPEQYGFKESDARSDIYSLGATIKYLMDKTGCKSKKLSQFVEKAMAFDPANRFQNMLEVLYFIRNYDEQEKERLERKKAAELQQDAAALEAAEDSLSGKSASEGRMSDKEIELEMERLKLQQSKNNTTITAIIMIVLVVAIVALCMFAM